MKLSYKIKNILFRVSHPSFWIQTDPSCEKLDDYINDLLDKVDNKEKQVIIEGRHTAKIGNCRLWVANYPYSYGNIYPDHEDIPYPLTRVRLKKAVAKASFDKIEENTQGT